MVPNGTAVTFSQSFNLTGTITRRKAGRAGRRYRVGMAERGGAGGGESGRFLSDVLVAARLAASPARWASSTSRNYSLSDRWHEHAFVRRLSRGREVSYGLDYAGTVTTAPETGSLLMLAIGMMEIALTARRRLLN